jgi:CheY-like chemotaxis protein
MKNILICDDSFEIAEVTKAILEGAGYHVEVFNCCQDSIVHDVMELKPDLILMDLWMGDIGGEEAILRLKADPGTKSIPVLVFTALLYSEKVVNATRADGFIDKPYALEKLLGTISNIFANRLTGEEGVGHWTVASS